MINQQTFAFAETRPFTAYENIVYPIHLTIAGADTMLLKIKVQELLPHKEVAIGEGILNIGTRNTNCSLRTIVYDCAFAL